MVVLKKLFSKELQNVKSDHYRGPLHLVYILIIIIITKKITRSIQERRGRLHCIYFKLSIQFHSYLLKHNILTYFVVPS